MISNIKGVDAALQKLESLSVCTPLKSRLKSKKVMFREDTVSMISCFSYVSGCQSENENFSCFVIFSVISCKLPFDSHYAIFLLCDFSLVPKCAQVFRGPSVLHILLVLHNVLLFFFGLLCSHAQLPMRFRVAPPSPEEHLLHSSCIASDDDAIAMMISAFHTDSNTVKM